MSLTWNVSAGVTGALGLGLLVVGLIFDSRLVFTLLAVDIGLLWAIATMHHVITSGV